MPTPDFGRALVLGALQGVTEFLPISSDGHLALARHFLGGSSDSLGETVLLHLGTLLATGLLLRAEVRGAIVSTLRAATTRRFDDDRGREARNVVLASIPTAAIGLAIEPWVESLSEDLRIVGAFLLVSAAFVGSTAWRRDGRDEVLSMRGAILVGVIQGLAVLPGWSRSGSTIAAAMALGLTPVAAFRFSFLLSLPAVAGACLLELRHAEVWQTFDGASYVGALVAFFTGLGALATIRGTLTSGRFAYFALYLVALAIAVLAIAS